MPPVPNKATISPSAGSHLQGIGLVILMTICFSSLDASAKKFKDSGASLDPAGVGDAHILAGIDVSAAGGLRGHSFCLPFIGNHPCGPASG